MPDQLAASAIALDDLFTPAELVAKYPNTLTINTLKWHLHNRSSNGLNFAVVKGLRRGLLISKSRFEQWLATRTEAGRAAV